MTTSNVFGLIVAGRLIQTDFVQVGPTEFLVDIPNAESVNHVVVFLTGAAPFPDELGGSVYAHWPSSSSTAEAVTTATGTTGAELNWSYLGYISNIKPSAIFRVAQISQVTNASCSTAVGTGGSSFFNTAAAAAMPSTMANNGVFASSSNVAKIGIQVEPLQQIEARVPVEGSSTKEQSTIEQFPARMLNHLVNHLQSYVVNLPRPDNPLATAEYVPMSALHDWYNTFRRRLQLNPNFWKAL